MKLQNTKGFTLIELLVVITIIGILATGAVATYTSQIQKARDTTRVNDVKALQSGIEQFYQDDGAYPEKGTDDFGSGGVAKYVERFPADSKSEQSCNTSGDSTQGSPCDYLYNVGADENTVPNQVYNLSTGFENSGNVSSKAENDNGVMDNRYEVGVGLKADSISSPLDGEVDKITGGTTCNTLTADTNYMLIRGNCE